MNFHVWRGRIYGPLGKNGAGRTTTMKMLPGLTPPNADEAILWGKTLYGSEKKMSPKIGGIIESPGSYPSPAGVEDLHIFAALRGTPEVNAVQDALTFVGLPYRDKKLFSQYSLDMKQRLTLALAVMHDPELLVLDEPINRLGPIGTAEVRTSIHGLDGKKGKTILLSSYILSEIVSLVGSIGVIDQGMLLEEESLEELGRKSNRYIHFIVSDTVSAALPLESIFQETRYTVWNDHHIIPYNLELPVERIISTHMENGLGVFEAHTCEETLEDYFKHATRSERIA